MTFRQRTLYFFKPICEGVVMYSKKKLHSLLDDQLTFQRKIYTVHENLYKTALIHIYAKLRLYHRYFIFIYTVYRLRLFSSRDVSMFKTWQEQNDRYRV